jgi:Putative lipoprotein GNA1162-like
MRSKTPSVLRSRDHAGRFISVNAVLLILGSIALSGCAQTNYQNRTFFREEYGVDTHGRKTWFDHLVELDPGKLKTHVAADYEQAAPERIAVLPFGDRGSAQYVVDKIPLTHRNGEEQADWAWTDANRMRRAVNGYLASREFLEANLIQVDEVLQEHKIDSEEKLDRVPPQTLGKWLGVDAVVYGDVTHYESYYAFLMSAWQVGADLKMVSTRNGEELFSAEGSRYSVDFMPAFDPVDIAINSGLALLELRDVTLARAEEEDAREIALRIPRSEKLKSELIEETRDEQELASDNTP